LLVRQVEQRMRSCGGLDQVRVNDNSAAAIAESCPTIRLTKNILSGHLSRAHYLISPKDVALRMAALGQQPIGQANRFYRLAVIDGANLDAGLLFKIVKNGFGIYLVLSAIGDDLGTRTCSGNQRK